jgi:hypothetical protein
VTVLWRIAGSRRLVRGLWLLVAYLLILYAALHWGHGPIGTYPGSD